MRKEEFRVLRETGQAKRFKFKLQRGGRYVVCLQARGTSAAGEWPAVRVVADGETLATFAVTTDYWWFYEAKAALGAGRHTVDVALLNGFRDAAGGENRFLYLNRLAVYRDTRKVPRLKRPSGHIPPTLPLD